MKPDPKPTFNLQAFAKSINAKLVLPSPAKHDRSVYNNVEVRGVYSNTNVKETWRLYGPEKEF